MASFAAPDLPVLGYHKIRGLAAPLRMMFYYKKASFINTAYGADMKETCSRRPRRTTSTAPRRHARKLEGFAAGTFMGGAAPQSGDFMLFEMIDQHMAIAAAVGAPAFFDAHC
ncbi:glutathione transferase [Aureococcus anophagefferens]|nr:glutathione transferase [Aureococcus anophagefferens]